MAILIIFFVSGGFAAISILIASIMKTRERFMGIGQALIMPLFFVSAVDAVRGLMISGDISNLMIDIAAIAIFDIIMFAAASISFRKIIE